MGNAGQYYVSGISVLILVYFNDIVMILTYCDVFFHLRCIVANLVLSKVMHFFGSTFFA